MCGSVIESWFGKPELNKNCSNYVLCKTSDLIVDIKRKWLVWLVHVRWRNEASVLGKWLKEMGRWKECGKTQTEDDLGELEVK